MMMSNLLDPPGPTRVPPRRSAALEGTLRHHELLYAPDRPHVRLWPISRSNRRTERQASPPPRDRVDGEGIPKLSTPPAPH